MNKNKKVIPRPEMFEVIRDFMGWTLIDKHNNQTYYNFLSEDEAINKANEIIKDLYKGGGVVI
jgi:hypothetical protein